MFGTILFPTVLGCTCWPDHLCEDPALTLFIRHGQDHPENRYLPVERPVTVQRRGNFQIILLRCAAPFSQRDPREPLNEPFETEGSFGLEVSGGQGKFSEVKLLQGRFKRPIKKRKREHVTCFGQQTRQSPTANRSVRIPSLSQVAMFWLALALQPDCFSG